MILTLMVGPSGAGKTTWLGSEGAKALGIMPTQILSPDTIRVEMGLTEGADLEPVFRALYKAGKQRVKCHQPTVIDACNLQYVTRKGWNDGHTPIRYIVINRPLLNKLESRGDRTENRVIKQHLQFTKEELKIMSGDGFRNVTVYDVRSYT